MTANEIAMGLTELQRKTVLKRGGDHDSIVAIDALWFCIIKISPTYFKIVLNAIGVEVRAILLSQEPKS